MNNKKLSDVVANIVKDLELDIKVNDFLMKDFEKFMAFLKKEKEIYFLEDELFDHVSCNNVKKFIEGNELFNNKEVFTKILFDFLKKKHHLMIKNLYGNSSLPDEFIDVFCFITKNTFNFEISSFKEKKIESPTEAKDAFSKYCQDHLIKKITEICTDKYKKRWFAEGNFQLLFENFVYKCTGNEELLKNILEFCYNGSLCKRTPFGIINEANETNKVNDKLLLSDAPYDIEKDNKEKNNLQLPK